MTTARVRSHCVLVLLLLSTGNPFLCGCTGGTETGGTPTDVSGEYSAREVPTGKCVADQDCDDNNPCTLDVCLSGGECKNKPQAGGGCDDENACTEKDTCDAAGTCVGVTVTCPASGACQWSECDPAQGCSVHEAEEGSPCDDGDPCTLGDTCAQGQCVPAGTKSCPDVNTTDCFLPSCNSKTGQCDLETPADEGTSCKDGNPCTKDDACSSDGKCKGGDPVECPQKPCWVSWCNEQTKEGADPCTGDWKDSGVGCDDESLCTTDDKCAGAGDEMVCQGQSVICDDDNPCTDESCEEGVGCSYQTKEDGAPCSDGEGACFVKGTCHDGQCLGSGPKCYDENPCTDNVCDAQSGECFFVPNSKPCDDGDLCTTGDVCEGGKCVGQEVQCDGENPCIEDKCNPLTGKCDMPVADGTLCGDGEFCNGEEACVNGECKSGQPVDCPDDGNPCTDQVCTPLLGVCESVPLSGTSCSDGDPCSGEETCQEGDCQPGAVPDCDDSNSCTSDSCEPFTGCLQTVTTGPCDDGNLCTADDTCLDGTCAGTPVVARCNTGDTPLVLSEKVRVLPMGVVAAPEESDCSGLVVDGTAEVMGLGLKEGLLVVSQEGGGVLCAVDSVTPQGTELLVVGHQASLEDLIVDGGFHLSLPLEIGEAVEEAAPMAKPLPMGKSNDLPMDNPAPANGNLKIVVKLPEQTIYDGPAGSVKLNPGSLTFSPTLDVDYGIWGGVHFSAVASGTATLKAGIEATFATPSLSAEAKIWKQSYPWYIPGTPVAGTVDVEVKVGAELSAGAGVDMAFGCTAERTVTAGVEYADGAWKPIKAESAGSAAAEPQEFEVELEATAKLYLDVKLGLKFYKVAGPYLTVSPQLVGTATPNLKPGLDLAVEGCIGAKAGGEVEILGFALAKCSVDILKYCWGLWNKSICFDTCLAPSSTCKNSSTVEQCTIDGDADPCLEKVLLTCPAGTECSTGKCQETCVPKNCQQLGKECGKWDDGCGKSLVCGTCAGTDQCDATGKCAPQCPAQCLPCQKCDAGLGKCVADPGLDNTSCGTGKYCSAGACVSCPSNFCQNNGYSSGTYCKDANTKVSCTTQGVCKGEANPTSCPNGCSGNACKAGLCDGKVCPDCQVCNAGNGLCEPDWGMDLGPCDGGGMHCSAGACLPCPSTYCQTSGYTSGPHCKDATTLVQCGWDGACSTQSASQTCPNGCQNNACAGAQCVDNDGDGYGTGTGCKGTDCDDKDKYIWGAGAPEYWDMRDNDCDGKRDEDGLVQFTRYRKIWGTNDWEHRYSKTSLSGWEPEGYMLYLYPTGFCSSGSYSPKDGCIPKNGGKEIELWGGFVVVALSECKGILNKWHITLYLPEDTGEYSDYAAHPDFVCSRIGYVWFPTWADVYPELKKVYRHESCFNGPTCKADNMWSSSSSEGTGDGYTVHKQSFSVPKANP